MPTDEEEAAIQRGIALDPDNPEWTEQDFKAARPASEVLPPELYARLTARSGKASVSLRLDQDVADALRASGPGWQARANQALRKLVLGSG